MSILYTRLVCDKIINEIKNDKIKSIQGTRDALSVLTGNFRRMGLADMCWNLRKIDLNYSTRRMLVHKYDYRFSNDCDFWNNLDENDKEELAILMNRFEVQTNILCGIQYDFYLGKKLTGNELNFISPYVYFLPAKNNGKFYLRMVNLSGDEVFFSADKNEVLYSKKIQNWEYNGVYSLNKLISAINDKRLILNLDSEVLVISDYGSR